MQTTNVSCPFCHASVVVYKKTGAQHVQCGKCGRDLDVALDPSEAGQVKRERSSWLFVTLIVLVAVVVPSIAALIFYSGGSASNQAPSVAPGNLAASSSQEKTVHVNEYKRRDGTQVDAYDRRPPGGGSDRQDAADNSSSSGTVHVRGYTKKDGTYVAPHERSSPSRRK